MNLLPPAPSVFKRSEKYRAYLLIIFLIYLCGVFGCKHAHEHHWNPKAMPATIQEEACDDREGLGNNGQGFTPFVRKGLDSSDLVAIGVGLVTAAIGLVTAAVLLLTLRQSGNSKRRDSTYVLIQRYNREDMGEARGIVYGVVVDHFRQHKRPLNYYDHVHKADDESHRAAFSKVSHYFDDVCNLYAAGVLDDKMCRASLFEPLETYYALFDLMEFPTDPRHDPKKAEWLGWDVFLKIKMRCMIAYMFSLENDPGKRQWYRWFRFIKRWLMWGFMTINPWGKRPRKPWSIPTHSDRRKIGKVEGQLQAEREAQKHLGYGGWPVDLSPPPL
ncbi:MAG: hypothetical protein AAF911_00850 [Planctomycetota bacterium]